MSQLGRRDTEGGRGLSRERRREGWEGRPERGEEETERKSGRNRGGAKGLGEPGADSRGTPWNRGCIGESNFGILRVCLHPPVQRFSACAPANVQPSPIAIQEASRFFPFLQPPTTGGHCLNCSIDSTGLGVGVTYRRTFWMDLGVELRI